eukprot:365674-Hanusia_phi.AAC.2
MVLRTNVFLDLIHAVKLVLREQRVFHNYVFKALPWQIIKDTRSNFEAGDTGAVLVMHVREGDEGKLT